MESELKRDGRLELVYDEPPFKVVVHRKKHK